MIKKLLPIVSLLGLISCASTPSGKTVQPLNEELDVKQTTGQGVIGIDKNNQTIFQKETMAADELRNQQWVNNALESSINDEYYWLKRCRTEIADPRLGGNSEVHELPEVDNMKTIVEVKEEFGLNKSGQLEFIKREDFLKKIDAERAYQVTLTSMLKTIRKNRDECERKMAKARVSAGLPATRYQGKFTLTNSGTIDNTLQENESSLDDAFRIHEQLKDSKEKKKN